MSLELSLAVTLSVKLILEVAEELFEGIKSRSDWDVRDHDRSFENCLETSLVTNFNNSLFDERGYLGTHSLRDLSSILPEHIDRLLLSLPSIGTHVKAEVLID